MKYFLLILFLFPGLLPDNDAVTTQRENNYIRSGPGAFYSLIEIVPRNIKLKVLDKENNWIKVQLSDKNKGWIAENCIKASSESSGLEKRLIGTKTTADVSKTTLTAAIKGLSGKGINVNSPGNIDRLNEMSERRIDPAKFKFFRREADNTESGNRGTSAAGIFQNEKGYYDPSIDELKVGFGTAAKLAGNISSDSRKDEYINLITNLLVSGSGLYDWEFRTFLLNDQKVNGYACPGGYIYITGGAYNLCQDESELAFIIAHEIAHVVMRHGLQELTKRKVHITSESSFDELEKETGEKISGDESDLNDIIEQTYEHIVHKRLLNYEIQADRAAAVLLANAGYDPFSSCRIAAKLSELYFKNKDVFDYNYSEPDAARLRYEEIKKFTASNFRVEKPGARLEKRFRSY
ncbi:MAG: M48 family metalloprotease [Syntrophothermus sp.]